MNVDGRINSVYRGGCMSSEDLHGYRDVYKWFNEPTSLRESFIPLLDKFLYKNGLYVSNFSLFQSIGIIPSIDFAYSQKNKIEFHKNVGFGDIYREIGETHGH